MKDKFNRELSIGDICFRIKSSSSRFGKPTLNVYKILDFSNVKVKIGSKTYVDSCNLVKASIENLENHIVTN